MGRKKVETGIFRDDKRKLYYVYLYFGKDKNGKAIKKYETTSSLKEARKIRNNHKQKVAAGQVVVPVAITLCDYIREYIDYKELTLASTTIYGYRNIFNNHLEPYFKDKRIQEIEPRDIEKYIVDKKANALLSINTIKKHIALLYSVFQDSCKKGVIPRNPMSLS